MDVAEFFSEFRRMCKSSSDCAKCQYHGDKCDNAIELLEKNRCGGGTVVKGASAQDAAGCVFGAVAELHDGRL